MLQQVYEKPGAGAPEVADLQKILLRSLESHDKAFIVMDALDECVESSDARQIMLDQVETLARGTPNLKILTTSRELRDIRESMEAISARPMPIATNAVNADIRRYVSAHSGRDRRLSRLHASTKTLIEKTISEKADGMFRWAYCQLQELKKLKSTAPKYVNEALSALPATLDDTYAQMLAGIGLTYQKHALTLLRWLSYAESPLSLAQLAEAAIIAPEAEHDVDVENRGDPEDTLVILAGLVTVEGAGTDEEDEHYLTGGYGDDDEGEGHDSDDSASDASSAHSDDFTARRNGRRISPDTKVRLPHFSVKEYLISDRISESSAKYFHLESSKEHNFIAQSCLAYLLHYSSVDEKTSTAQDLDSFPLLRYSARSWCKHLLLPKDGDSRGQVGREIVLLNSEKAKRDWSLTHQPEFDWRDPFEDYDYEVGTGFYYASCLELQASIGELFRLGVDANVQGGYYSNALQAASYRSSREVVQLLLEKGAEVNAQGWDYGNALQAARQGGETEVMQMLLDAGAIDTSKGKEQSGADSATSSDWS